MKKTIYLLNIDNYAPEIRTITMPFLKCYADRIGADIFEITERKFPGYPVTYEKLQIFELGKLHKNDWNIYIDSDALIHPMCPDFTLYLTKSFVGFNSYDYSWERFKMDEYFFRDGRCIGAGNWFTVGSDLCLDLWRPLELPLNEILSRIRITPDEIKGGVSREHLIDDFAISNNISRFGLKFRPFSDIIKENLGGNRDYVKHNYLFPSEIKIKWLNEAVDLWKVRHVLEAWS